MKKQQVKRNLVLGILFFLPVTFLLFLYPAKHHYNPLDVVHENVSDLQGFSSLGTESVKLKNHITVLGFLGNNPDAQSISALNVKELVYDKFKGFKKFQLVMVLPKGSETKAEALKKEISSYEDLKYWHFVFASPSEIQKLYKSLKTHENLSPQLASEAIFIIDKNLNQRGRLDDREEKDIKNNKPQVALYGYSTIKIAELKNKFGDDLRVLFQEYRDLRKGDLDSNTRRENELKQQHGQD